MQYFLRDDFNQTFNAVNCKGTNFFHINISSFTYNLDLLHTLLSQININFDLTGITESWLKKYTTRTNNIDINSYTFEHTPTEASCGEPLLYIKDTLKYKCRKNLQIYKAAGLESTFIELLSSSGKNTIVGCIYRHPCMHSSEFNSIFLNDLLEKLSHENKNNILMGDFNIDLLKYDIHGNSPDLGVDGVDMKCATVNTCGNVTNMCVVPVNLTYSRSGKIAKSHALLYSCSQGTFMLEKLLQDLGLNGQKASITIKTVNGEVNSKTTLVKGLKVSSSRDEDGEWTEIPKTFTRMYLPVDQDDIATSSKLKQWKYLECIVVKISKRDVFFCGFTVGANCTKALEPLNIIPSCENGPYEFQTRLGWCITVSVNGGN